MEVNVRCDRKIIDIWLSRAEQEDPALLDRAKGLCARYASQGYLAAVYKSGGEDLADLTAGLLIANQKRPIGPL